MNKKKLAILTGGKEGLGRELQKELDEIIRYQEEI